VGAALAATAGLVALCLVAVAGATNPQTYPDPVDTNPAPDVTSVTVSNDISGTVSVRIELANRPSGLTAGDNLYMYVNTDRDTSTGCAGSEYRIYAFGSPLQFGVDPCVNGAFTEAGACCGSFSSGGISFTIPADRIGHSTDFWFWIATAVNGNFGPPQGDYVPDSDPSGSPLQYDAGQTLTLTFAGPGEGKVTSPARSLECDASCSATFDTGTSVTLTATPASGSTFAGWSGDCSGTGTCTVTMSAAHGVTATFDRRKPHGKKRMHPVVKHGHTNLKTTEDLTWWQPFTVWSLPPGAKVVFGCCHRHEVAHADAQGHARSRLVSGHRFHRGEVITAALSKKGYYPCTLRVKMLIGDYRVSTSGRCTGR